MDQEPESRNLTVRVARYWSLGWAFRRIAETLRISKSTVANITRTPECKAERERIESEKFDRVTMELARSGVKAVRTLNRCRKNGTKDDVVKVQSAADILNATVRLIGFRARSAAPPSSGNEVVFVDIVPPSSALPPSPLPAEPAT